MAGTLMQNYKCEICRSQSWEILLKDTKVSVCSGSELIKNDSPLIKIICSHCGFMHTLNSPLDVDIAKYYASDYSAKLEDKSLDYKNFSTGKYFADTLNSFVLEHKFPAKGRLLDIGCGKGVFEKGFLSEYPEWEAVGVDPSLKTVEFAKKNAPEAEFLCAPFERKDFEGQKFDLICMHTILNRVPPREFISSAAQLINTDGILSIAIAILPMAPFELFFADHHYMYFAEHLQALCEEFGFECIKDSRKGSVWRFLFKVSDNPSSKCRDMLFERSDSYSYLTKQISDSWVKIFSEVEALKQEGKKVAFYGSGTSMHLILGQTDFPTELIYGFFDENEYKQGQTVSGVVVEPFSEKINDADAVVLCAGPDGAERMRSKLKQSTQVLALDYIVPDIVFE